MMFQSPYSASDNTIKASLSRLHIIGLDGGTWKREGLPSRNCVFSSYIITLQSPFAENLVPRGLVNREHWNEIELVGKHTSMHSLSPENSNFMSV